MILLFSSHHKADAAVASIGVILGILAFAATFEILRPRASTPVSIGGQPTGTPIPVNFHNLDPLLLTAVVAPTDSATAVTLSTGQSLFGLEVYPTTTVKAQGTTLLGDTIDESYTAKDLTVHDVYYTATSGAVTPDKYIPNLVLDNTQYPNPTTLFSSLPTISSGQTDKVWMPYITVPAGQKTKMAVSVGQSFSTFDTGANSIEIQTPLNTTLTVSNLGTLSLV